MQMRLRGSARGEWVGLGTERRLTAHCFKSVTLSFTGSPLGFLASRKRGGKMSKITNSPLFITVWCSIKSVAISRGKFPELLKEGGEKLSKGVIRGRNERVYVVLTVVFFFLTFSSLAASKHRALPLSLQEPFSQSCLTPKRGVVQISAIGKPQKQSVMHLSASINFSNTCLTPSDYALGQRHKSHRPPLTHLACTQLRDIRCIPEASLFTESSWLDILSPEQSHPRQHSQTSFSTGKRSPRCRSSTSFILGFIHNR